jgi:hypothetical protein
MITDSVTYSISDVRLACERGSFCHHRDNTVAATDLSTPSRTACLGARQRGQPRTVHEQNQSAASWIGGLEALMTSHFPNSSDAEAGAPYIPMA